MKQFLLTSACILVTFFGHAQDYKVDEARIYNYSSGTSDWEQSSTVLYTYDNGGTKDTNELNISFPSLVYTGQYNKTYNENNDIILSETQDWDETTETWENISQASYTYNDDNNLEFWTIRSYNSNTMLFEEIYRRVYIYYAGSSNVDTEIQQLKNTNTNSWVNNKKTKYTYTTGLETLRVESDWDSNNNTWIDNRRFTTTYNSNNLIDLVTIENKNDTAWDLYSQSIYTYSANNLLTNVISQGRSGSIWVNWERILYNYDTNENRISSIYENWNSSITDFMPYLKLELTYSIAEPLSITTFETYNFKLYPNPVKDILHLEFNSVLGNDTIIQLFTIDGKLIKVENLILGQNQFQLNVNHLQKGIYLLKLNGNHNQTFKFLKE